MPSSVIEVENLVKVYSGGTRAVDGISFHVGAGELLGFLGPNGAGKTTTIRILATLLAATSGAARVAGFDVTTQASDVRRRLGLAMQTPTLDTFATGRENIELIGRMHRVPRAELKRRTDELLELMGLTAVARKLAGTYSGGMRRRLDLACALVHRPQVLILDEPTEGLDPQSRIALWDELERISQDGTTMLLTTHYMEEADRLCNRVAIIDNGRIVVDGSPADLKAGIGADTVTLQLDANGPEDLARQQEDVRGLLRGFGSLESVTPEPFGVRLAIRDAGRAIPELMRRLDGNGRVVHVIGLAVGQPSLDDVFVKYTGRRIRAEAADHPIILGW
ncbi:MAG: ATP-binding cassette domain-containing protein [Chloroflexi bacterium]|nr:MAG: ATP-binding cassette domain-containing protein [Chloroflexota bacterium]TMF34896.1 MAG: ATP-binding cassette domain-containing protein [Chloroflexota bacterium]